jgi:predicted NUDIX family NTP pyrophosphohydrolase
VAIKQSAGLLVYRETDAGVEIFLVHPGGPFFAKKDDGVWSIPKGEFDDEDPLTAARREFEEETGQKIAGDFFALTPIKQKGGKIVYAWAVEADIDADAIDSNTFEMEWPPRSGKTARFPEIDRAAWFNPATAKQKINHAKAALIDDLIKRI